MNLNKNITSLLNLIKLIVSVMYLEHLFACLWFFLGRYFNAVNENNWLLSKNLVD